MKHSSKLKNGTNIEPWIKAVLAQEDTEPRHKLWETEPAAAYFNMERKRRVRFLRSIKDHLSAKAIAEHLDKCVKGERCCSGACPECAHLMQRRTFRHFQSYIPTQMDALAHEVIAFTIMTESLAQIDPHKFVLHDLPSIYDRLTSVLRKTHTPLAICGFSLSVLDDYPERQHDESRREDRGDEPHPFWFCHLNIIALTCDRETLRKALGDALGAIIVNRPPTDVRLFDNVTCPQPGPLKDELNDSSETSHWSDPLFRDREWKQMTCETLAPDERLQWFEALDKLGLASQVRFWGIDPQITPRGVKKTKIGSKKPKKGSLSRLTLPPTFIQLELESGR